jgi:hypothetical protein
MRVRDEDMTELLRSLPSEARLVLHVGCGAGALGAAYKRRNPAARVLGIESDAEAAEIAARALDRVYRIDPDSEPSPFADDLAGQTIDCVIYDRAFSRAAEPWAILARHAAFLSDTATVILLAPNPDHWTALEDQMKGIGVGPDKRFTGDAIQAGFANAGLIAIDRVPLSADAAACDAFVGRVAPALRALGVDVASYRARAAPAWWLWRARRRPTPRVLTVVSTMLSPVGGVSEVRVTAPMRALTSDPGLRTRVISSGEEPPADIDGPRIFIFHRPLLAGEQGLRRIRQLIDAGWLVLCEFDDHPEYIAVLQRPDVQNFRAVHAVQTSTTPLAAVLGRDNPEVRVFGNAVEELPEIANFRDEERMTLFFAGLNREKDWPPCIDAINAVAARFGARLRFEVVNDRGFFDALRTPHKNFTPLCDYGVYQDILGRCEISFMPLADTPFNRCKSDLKFIEAGARRVTALASAVAYPETIEDGRTGILFQDADDLEHRLTRLVGEPRIALAIGDAARDYVTRHRMLSSQVADRAAWYRSLWDRREELNRSLLARVPELATL